VKRHALAKQETSKMTKRDFTWHTSPGLFLTCLWMGFGGATWSPILQERQLPCPKCQGSLLRFSETQLLFSNPDPGAQADGKPEGKRLNLTVRLSPDDGKTWPVARLLHQGPAAYSCLGQLGDGTILCLYEGGEKNPAGTIRLARFNLEWLTRPAPR